MNFNEVHISTACTAWVRDILEIFEIGTLPIIQQLNPERDRNVKQSITLEEPENQQEILDIICWHVYVKHFYPFI